MNTVGQTISEKKLGDIHLFNEAPNGRIWSITFKHGNEHTMQFSLIGGRSTGTYRILWPNHDAGRVLARNGLHPVRNSASACFHRRHSGSNRGNRN